MSENYLLVPAIVHFNFGSKKVNMTDYQIDVTIDNGCHYIEAIDAKGRKNYSIQKGSEVKQDASIKVSILKTPDKQFDSDIKRLKKALQSNDKNDPKKYTENITFSFATNDDKDFAHMKFKGYISEIYTEMDEETALSEVTAEIAIYDPSTFKIK